MGVFTIFINHHLSIICFLSFMILSSFYFIFFDLSSGPRHGVRILGS